MGKKHYTRNSKWIEESVHSTPSHHNPSVSSMQDLETRAHGASLTLKRSSLYARVDAIHKSFQEKLTVDNFLQYKPSFERLSMHQANFDDIQSQIMEHNAKVINYHDRIEVDGIQTDFDTLIQSAEALYLSFSAKTPEPSAPSVLSISATSQSSKFMRLPKIDLPKFSGKIEDWRSFYNLFKVSVHSVGGMGAVEKFSLLLRSVQGEALDLIKGLDITESNYDTAMELLCKRYDCKRRHIYHHYFGLLDLPELKHESQTPSFLTKVREHTQALEGLDHKMECYSSILTAIITRKLSPYLKKRLDDYRGPNVEYPVIKDILDFLEKECIRVDEVPANGKSNTQKSNFQQRIPRTLVTADTAPAPETKQQSKLNRRPSRPSGDQKSANSCPLCYKPHTIHRCDIFLSKTVEERQVIVKEHKLCFNCLKPHFSNACDSTGTCRVCQKKHNSLLHKDTQSSDFAKSIDTSLVSTTLASTRPQRSQVLLATVLARISNPSGRTHVVRGLLDSASHRTLITTRAAQAIRLKYRSDPQAVSGLSEIKVNLRGNADISITTLANVPVGGKRHAVDIIDSITAPLPSYRVSTDVHSKIRDLELADPQFDLPGPIDILFGADLLPHIFTGAFWQLGPEYPLAMPTIFGLALLGPTPLPESSSSNPRVTLLSVDPSAGVPTLNECMQRFWKLEEPPASSPLSKEEQLAEESFAQSHTRTKDGKYVVRLPLKPDHPPLGDTYNQAHKRFLNLERQLNAQPQLKAQYTDFMDEYLDSGHMAPISEVPTKHCFLAHHGVKKEQSSTTKLRVVFDASAKSSTGVSLNDIQLTGPKLQRDIRNVITAFRRFKIPFTCDVRQMYRHIWLHEDDQPFQLILWRSNPTLPIQIFKLLTVTFGLGSSPFLALRTLRQLAIDHQAEFPRAAQIILNDVYVDDVASGADCIVEAKEIIQELIALFKLGGFDLRKWTSSCLELLKSLPSDQLETPVTWDDSPNQAFSMLGLIWLPKDDLFAYRVNPSSESHTKRGALSTIASIYDPCSWLAPVVFLAKCFIQHLWLLKLGWDTPLPPATQAKWNNFLAELPSLKQIRVPRHIPGLKHPVQVHGFCDASEQGYAAVVYLRTPGDDGKFNVSLFQAKTKVAPLKRVTIPRLELCGASLLSDALQQILPELQRNHNISSVHAWSDSKITLAWIQTQPHKLLTFVANRVSKIQEALPDVIWNFVKGVENPADAASRGVRPSQLKDLTLWWKGPDWLSKPADCWPTQFTSDSFDLEPLPETKRSQDPPILVNIVQPTLSDYVKRFSSWTKLQRTFAYVLRSIYNLRHSRQHWKAGPLSSAELTSARIHVLRQLQLEHFSQDVNRLQHSETATYQQARNNPIVRLKPFIDQDGLLRVGGRISRANLPQDRRHPILLPKASHVTHLIINYYHLAGLHSGLQLTQALFNQSYWIICSRQVIRSVIFKCITCFRAKPINQSPMMADLPKERVTRARPFLKSGMDLCGPFPVKIHTLRSARTVNCYVCVFVCMSSKAVHLEVLEDLSTIAFRGALTRFASRRGWPTDLFSDQGTNFVGASNQYRKAWSEFLKTHADELMNFGATQGLTFHFNPPASPHHGGLWEAAVKSMKHHLTRTLGDQVLYFLQFQTLIAQIEALLNSRPLVPLSSDPSDFSALTPGHFLTGGPIVASPEPDWQGPSSTSLKQWQQVQQFTNHIWKRWQNEYLQSLQSRHKWNVDTPNLKKDDMVILHDAAAPPLKWKICRVLDTYPGKDGVVRVAKIRTPTTELTRPVTKLFPLPHVSD